MNFIESHIEKVLELYTHGEYYELLKDAKQAYTDLTGKMDEDVTEYETRMNSFNDWYIFNYRREDHRRVIDDYIQNQKIGNDLARAFHNVNYSLFHFVKINFRKQIVFKDILHDEKIVLNKEDCQLGLLEDDIFVGRIISFEDHNYLLKGVSTLPRETFNILKKQSRKIRKLNSTVEEEKFLLTLEKLKVKSMNYGHISSEQIFVF